MKKLILALLIPLILASLLSCEKTPKDPLAFRAPPCSFSGTAREEGKKTEFTLSFDAEGVLTLTVTSEGALKGAVYRTEGGDTTLTQNGIGLPVIGRVPLLAIFGLFELQRSELKETESADGSPALLRLTFPQGILTLYADTGLPCRYQTEGIEFILRDFRTNAIQTR